MRALYFEPVLGLPLDLTVSGYFDDSAAINGSAVTAGKYSGNPVYHRAIPRKQQTGAGGCARPRTALLKTPVMRRVPAPCSASVLRWFGMDDTAGTGQRRWQPVTIE